MISNCLTFGRGQQSTKGGYHVSQARYILYLDLGMRVGTNHEHQRRPSLPLWTLAQLLREHAAESANMHAGHLVLLSHGVLCKRLSIDQYRYSHQHRSQCVH